MDHNAVGKLKRKKFMNEDKEEEHNAKLLNSQRDQSDNILQQILILKSAASSALSHRVAVTAALDLLSELARDDNIVDTIVNLDAIPVISRLLFHLREENGSEGVEVMYDLQRGCILVLGLLARRPKYKQLIVDAGALPYLVDLLRMYKFGLMSQALIDLLKTTTKAIARLSYNDPNIKILISNQGGIPPLVELLEFNDSKVQRAAIAALRTLAFENDDNNIQIVKCKALPIIVSLLQSEDPTIHYEAVGVIKSLVHTSLIKELVFEAGALQPLILLLRSSCLKTKILATSVIGEFAQSHYQAQIAQRGAIRPLVDQLKSSDELLCAMSAFVLGQLAQDSNNQAGIAYNGGIEPLLNLLGSKDGRVQHHAAYALSYVASNEDSVVDIIKAGGLHKLLNAHLILEASEVCVRMTLKRLEEKMHGRVLKHLLNLMRFADKGVQRLVAIALAHLCSPHDHKTIFIVNNGLDLLMDLLLESTNSDISAALHKLATKAMPVSLVDVAPPSPTSQVLGEEYVNNPEMSDVTFIVEGKRFYAHRVCLLASSDLFRAMFDGGYMESEATDIDIPDIKWDVFELMMRFIYTGEIYVRLNIAEDLLRVADQYLLEGLKRLCEHAISQGISVDNVLLMYDISEAFNATSLRNACILFVLEQFEKLSVKPWYYELIDRIAPDIRNFFSTLLTKPDLPDS